MTNRSPAEVSHAALTSTTASALFGRALGEAVIAHRITTGDTVLALTEGALNLLQKAESLLAEGRPDDRPRALALIERALRRLPKASDIVGLPDIHDHVIRLGEHAADLRSHAETSSPQPPA